MGVGGAWWWGVLSVGGGDWWKKQAGPGPHPAVCLALSQPYRQLCPMVLALLCTGDSWYPDSSTLRLALLVTLHLALSRDLWPQ